MAWNNPSDGNKYDPWSGKRKSDTPPDLEEVLQHLRKNIKKLLPKGKRTPSGGTKQPFLPSLSFGVLSAYVIIIMFAIWFFSGFFIVSVGEKAAILRYGKYRDTYNPGWHWIPPLIESRYVVNIQRVTTYALQTEALTKDKNRIQLSLNIQYRITDLRHYLFNVSSPEQDVEEVVANTVNISTTQTDLEDIISSAGREKMQKKILQALQQKMTTYQTGVTITEVQIKTIKPPIELTKAFDEVINSRKDAQLTKEQALMMAKEKLIAAENNAQLIRAAAQADKVRIISMAQGEIERYLNLLNVYHASPLAVRENLYFSMLQSIFKGPVKIIIDDANQHAFAFPSVYFDADGKDKEINLEERKPTSITKQGKANIILEDKISRPSYSQNFRG